MYNSNGSFGQIFSSYSRMIPIAVVSFAGGIIVYYTTNISKNFSKNCNVDSNQISTDLKNNIDTL